MKSVTFSIVLWEKGDIAVSPEGLCLVTEDETVHKSLSMGFLSSTIQVKHLEDGCANMLGSEDTYDRQYLSRATDEEVAAAKASGIV